MRHTSSLLAFAALGLLASLPLGLKSARAGGATSRPDTMPVSQIHRGMKGYGLTVFEGTRPERFDVEVIDVLKNFRPRQDLVLIKTKHPRLEIAKVVAGMSGSPIYLDNKMIGAYAYGWSFGSEPVAGVTPIDNMIEDLQRPLPDKIFGWPLKPGGSAPKNPNGPQAMNGASRFRGVGYDLREHAAALAQRAAPAGAITAAPVATPLLVGGMSNGAIALARDLLSPLGIEPLQAGGGGTQDPAAPKRYEDGGAIGVQLIRGDMSAMGLGTVTRVEGDKLVAFGHPMMEAGVTSLPTCIGKVLWFLASDQRSFKIGMGVRDVGALIQDRQASITISHSAQAPVVPLKVSIKGMPGLPSSNWSFEIAHEKFMTPSFLSVAIGSALQAVANERQDVSWTAVSKLKIRGYGEIRLEDYGVAMGGTPEAGEFARSNLVRAVGAVMNNPWQPAFIEGAEVEVELHYARDILRLRGAELLEPEIDAGEPARIRVTLVPYSGPEQTRILSVPLPAYMAGQTVSLDIAPGYTEEREVAAPDSLKEMIGNFVSPIYPPKSLVVSFDSGAGLAFRGRVAKNLPPGAVDAIRPTTSSIGPDSVESSVRAVTPVGQFVVGRDRVSVVIRQALR
ncbi:MAG TPA: SpoIVB peptidase S55 domain-containing protein [Polyangiaceae bacterium]|nr:SpoIVB peptidase S55 domain-containing protein [Polyangiaceae bacterium]